MAISKKAFWTRTITIIVNLLLLFLVAAYFIWWIPDQHQELHLAAVAKKDIAINEKIDEKSFYNKVVGKSDKYYRYLDPRGAYASKNIKLHEELNATNVTFSKRFYSSSARLSLPIDERFGSHIKVGDEIALSINGKIFPEIATARKGLIIIHISGPSSNKIHILVQLEEEHLSDTFWIRKADDFIFPIILRSSTKHAPSADATN